MIWNPCDQNASSCSPIVSHIAGEVDALCKKEFCADFENVEEVAKAIECFLKENRETLFVDSKYLMLLASQAMSSLGQGMSARRLLIFGSGLVAPAEWQVTGGNAMWVLDLKRMIVGRDVSLELLLFNSLNVILDAISDVWDETKGRGSLGLKHVCCVASALLAKPEDNKDSRMLAAEINARCKNKLKQIAMERNWADFPSIINLDS